MKVPIWSPSSERVHDANVTALVRRITARRDAGVTDYASLYRFSVDHLDAFWSELWDFFDVVGNKGSEILVNRDSIIDARWFGDAELNFAENHLRRRDDAPAIFAYAEDQPRRVLSWRELYDSVSTLRAALIAVGVGPGDRVAACLPNAPEAVIALLATASIGAVWSACSPDYGVEAIVDRLSQIEPKVLFVANGYRYNGKVFDLGEKNAQIRQHLPSLRRTVIVPFLAAEAVTKPSADLTSWDQFVAEQEPAEVEFPRFPFDHPLYILYSSGTTGKPKAIVHGAGGSLLQSVKELVIHCDLRQGEPALFQTTTGWMVWNVMVAALAWQSPVVLYDGSPSYPTLNRFFDIIADSRAGVVRIVPPLIELYGKAGLRPREHHDLSCLRCILSGSAPLLPHHYQYVYQHIKTDLHLASPAGGTDIMGSLVSGNPIGPVYPGEIQARSLGMMVEIFDETGRSLLDEPGELVCTRPFPSVPLGFWGRAGRQPIVDQYLSTFPNVWRHGDWAKLTPEGGMIIYGRSDATLNVNGVRIGTAEIYRGLEKVPDVKEAVAIAQQTLAGERIVLFVVLETGLTLDMQLTARINTAIRETATSRHIPARIVQVADLLRSLNGKPSEVAIRNVVNGRPLSSQLGLSNPEMIQAFRDIPALRDQREA